MHIAGAIKNPGIIEIEKNDRILDIIRKAGDLNVDANIQNINLAEKVEDGLKIYIPTNAELETQNSTESVVKDNQISNTNKININTASVIELDTLPGIGEATANKIIEYRDENGKYNNTEELKNVKGIGQSKYDEIEDKIEI